MVRWIHYNKLYLNILFFTIYVGLIGLQISSIIWYQNFDFLISVVFTKILYWKSLSNLTLNLIFNMYTTL